MKSTDDRAIPHTDQPHESYSLVGRLAALSAADASRQVKAMAAADEIGWWEGRMLLVQAAEERMRQSSESK